MNRREFLATTTVTAVSLAAGCSAIADDESGRTYTLEIREPIDEPTEPVLEYETAGLSLGQEKIVEEAVRTGAYSEAGVTWSTQPGREPITMEFRMVLQQIARHLDRETELVEPMSFEAPSAFDGRRYRSVVDVS